jgi:hypothetical protein
VVKIRKLATDAALAAFAESKPGRPRSVADAELDGLRAENARLGRGARGAGGRVGPGGGNSALGLSPGAVLGRVDGDVKNGLLKLVDDAVEAGWARARACGVLGVADVWVHRWRARRREVGTLVDRAPGGNPVHGLLA